MKRSLKMENISILRTLEKCSNVKKLRTAEPQPIFTGSYKKKKCIAILRSESQKEMSCKVDQQNHKHFTETIAESGNTREMARISSLSLPYAGAWLNATPSPALGLHLRPSEFVVSVQYRLGLNIFQTEGKCTACPHQSDRRGDHAISCDYEGERIARHDHLRNALYNTVARLHHYQY